MEIVQNDIFGKKHQTKDEKVKKSTTPQAKDFFNITIQNGLDERDAAADAMLIHRFLQRRLLYSGLNSPKHKSAFLKILKNELKIKSGQMDPVSATRDSLLEFFVQIKR